MAAGVNLRTTDDLPISATNPLQVATVGGTGTSSQQVQGPGANASAVVGNPVVGGGVFNTNGQVLTNGQGGFLQVNGLGALRSSTVLGTFVGVRGYANTSLGLAENGAGQGRMAAAASFKSNGTSWDPDFKANASSVMPSSSATDNASTAKAAAGELHNVIVNNTNAAIRYLKFYNKATTPVVGTDIPVLVFALKPLDITVIPLGGHYFSAGISWATVTGAANSDTTPVGAGDLVGLTITYA